MQITKIPPKPAESARKLRVAAYCRVSTDYMEQLASLETQKTHYETYIKKNTEWDFAGIYFDEGISGTKKAKRAGLLKLIKDCENQKIDLILTKSISRFARNTMDCLEIVRYLTDLGVSLYFEEENINTSSMESELILTILSGLAESESSSISKNTKWAIQKRFEQGSYMLCSPPYGYDYYDGELVINKDQALIVQRIFTQALCGKSADKIAEALTDDDVPTQRGGGWAGKTVMNILRNERYTGAALFQKTYTDEQYIRRKNQGEKSMYLIEDHHEAIISQEDFEAVGALLDRRRKAFSSEPGKYHNRYPFSGKLKCSCGCNFKRRAESNQKVSWACAKHIKDQRLCSMKAIREESIQGAFTLLMNKLIFGYAFILKPLRQSLRKDNSAEEVLKVDNLSAKILEIEEKRRVLGDLMTKYLLDQTAYIKKEQELKAEEAQLKEEQELLQQRIQQRAQLVDEVKRLDRFISKAEPLAAFDEALFSQFVDGIEVYSQVELGFKLKCGLTLKERVVRS